MAAVQSIGERLREARMRQKIDIADVETATKIRAKYLRALENEEFGLLPGPTFVKTFLRTYAEYLGLDAQLLVEEYRVQYEPRGEEVAPIGATSSGRSARRGGGGGRAGGGGRGSLGPPGPGVVFGGIFVLLLAVIIILGLTADDKDSGGGGKQSSQQARDESAAKAKERERAAARKRRAAARRRKARARPKTVQLRLTPSAPVYACVVDGSGKQLFGGTLSAPETFKAKHIRINLGRPDVRVTIAGKRLKIPPGSNPVGYDLRAGKKPRPLPLGQRPNC
jgi:cytoskeleton protein RodZ